jgi:disulfide bond formation protein DsbB
MSSFMWTPRRVRLMGDPNKYKMPNMPSGNARIEIFIVLQWAAKSVSNIYHSPGHETAVLMSLSQFTWQTCGLMKHFASLRRPTHISVSREFKVDWHTDVSTTSRFHLSNVTLLHPQYSQAEASVQEKMCALDVYVAMWLTEGPRS